MINVFNFRQTNEHLFFAWSEQEPNINAEGKTAEEALERAKIEYEYLINEAKDVFAYASGICLEGSYDIIELRDEIEWNINEMEHKEVSRDVIDEAKIALEILNGEKEA